MSIPEPTDLAQRYFVNDLPGSSVPASRLRGILDKLQDGRPLTTNGFDYLQQLGLIALQQLARGEVTHESFSEIAAREKAEREAAVEGERQAKIASLNALEAKYQAQREAERLARESDPKYIAKMKNRALRERYGVDMFIEQNHFPNLMNILRRFDNGKRLTDDDILWLTTKGREYFSEMLETAHHKREAEFYSGKYRQTRVPWNAVNASSHYRKCGEAREAHELLTSIPSERKMTPKLRSAIATTHGGAMRDLERLHEAVEFGEQAHNFAPRDFRPCTLLGAVNFELGHYYIARDWYAKAVERGATERSVDSELRSIFLRADPDKRQEISAFLLREDPTRFDWVTKLQGSKHHSMREFPNKLIE